MKNILWVFAIIIILGAGYVLYQGSSTVPTESDVADTADNTAQTGAPIPGSDTPEREASADVSVGVGTTTTVTYDGKSFSPSEVTIKKGGTVTWTNSGSGRMWVASAQHPTHMIYAGTSREDHCPDTAGTAFDQCAGGSSYSFTFEKAGTWNYHDHINATVFGKVKVVE